MSDTNKENDKKLNEKKSAGEILPDDKKHLLDEMPESVKSPLVDIKDKSDVKGD